MTGRMAAFSIVCIFALTVVSLNHIGKRARVYALSYPVTQRGIPVTVVKSLPEAYALWKKSGYHGRIVIHIGEYLHFVAKDENSLYKGLERFPVKPFSLLEEYERRLGDDSFLWTAMQAGIAREIYNILPPKAFGLKLGALSTAEERVKVSEHMIVTDYLGSKRLIMDYIPSLTEPVLLTIDASFFRDNDAAGLFDALKKAGIRTDMLILSLSEDNPGVTEKERKMLMEFPTMLAEVVNE